VKHSISTFIHLLDQKSLLNHIHTLLLSKFGNFIHIFNGNRKFLANKDYFYLGKVDISFEMMQSGPIVPEKKGLLWIGGLIHEKYPCGELKVPKSRQ